MDNLLVMFSSIHYCSRLLHVMYVLAIDFSLNYIIIELISSIPMP